MRLRAPDGVELPAIPKRDRAAIVIVSRHGSRTRGNSPSRFGYVSGGRVRRRGTWFSRQGQLALSGNPLKGFRRAFDPILAVVVFRRKLADDLVGACGRRTRDVARGEIDGRPNGELVFQRPLLLACRQEPLVPLPEPACLYKYRAYITPPPALTSDLTTWQTRRLRDSSTGWVRKRYSWTSGSGRARPPRTKSRTDETVQTFSTRSMTQSSARPSFTQAAKAGIAIIMSM